MGKAMREAPAQAELRPTSAGAFGVILPYGVTPLNSAVEWSTNFIEGDLWAGHAGSPGSGRVRLRPNRGFPRHPALWT
jgi:hypothetical protein